MPQTFEPSATDAISLLCARVAPGPEFFAARLERIAEDPDVVVATLRDLVDITWTLLDQLAPPGWGRQAVAREILTHPYEPPGL